jgi:hypothetical protein
MTSTSAASASGASLATAARRLPHWRLGSAKKAAERVTRCGRLELPGVGSIPLPPSDQVAYLAGVGTLVLFGVVEWPVGVLLGAGHLLAADRDNRLISAFGEALDKA